MTVVKRDRSEEPDFQAFIEGNEIPPHLVESLKDMNSGNGGQWPVPEMIEPMADETAGPMDPSAEYRVEILGKAAHIVSQDRNVAYGAPENTFGRIADMWAAYLGLDTLHGADVAAMLALMKIARIATNPLHEDSWIDLAGYAACGASVSKDLMEGLSDGTV